jgi:cell wall-associated NlpC family hydrolase
LTPARRGARALAAAALMVTMLGLPAFTAASAGAPKPPPNPSNRQITQAQAARDALASQAGVISARIASAEAEIQRLDSAAQLAEQKLALALQRLNEATTRAAQTVAQLHAAQAALDQARQDFSSFIHASYMNSSLNGMTGALLTAPDPNVLLQQVAVDNYVASKHLDALGKLQLATVGRSNADAAARNAVALQTKAAVNAQAAQRAVVEALTTAQNVKASLAVELQQDRNQLAAAQIKLTGLKNQRAAFKAWQAQQAAIAAARAARLRAQKAAQAAAAAANAAAQAGRGRGGWSAAKGQQAVNRAMHYLGMRYAFAAGNTAGPTYGVCEPGDAWNDCRIFGFDCSGLSLYAWAPYLPMDHFAATQYSQVGSYHPSIENLMPGDLTFWSGDGSAGGIGHVAMYIGGGNVIQAPQSGDVIRITNVYDVEAGYYGATRPLT